MADPEEAPTRRRRPRLTLPDGENNDEVNNNHHHNNRDFGEGEEEESRQQRSTIIKRKKKRRERGRELEQPFYILFLQVGATLFLLCSASFFLFRSFVPESPSSPSLSSYLEGEGTDADADDDDVYTNAAANLEDFEAEAVVPTQAPTVPTAPPLPIWDLGKAATYDAFGIAAMRDQASQNNGNNNNEQFWDTAADLRAGFAELYGGENAVRAMMERGMSFFPVESAHSTKEGKQPPSDLVATACRIRRAKEEGRPFKFTFGGYSVTVGRGNYFEQSFPFVMNQILEEPFELLGIGLSVKNAAIGGCPSFPYGFCKKNHWGDDSDVVSWDFSMNEAGGIAEGLEAYLRHTMTLAHRPKLILKDTFMAEKRRALLRAYVDVGAISDPMVLHSDPAVRPFLERREDFRPVGFREWRKFGSPPGAPGQALHHPAVKEHEMAGWLLAMHFLSALELVAATEEENENMIDALKLSCPSTAETEERRLTNNLLPPPVLLNATTAKEWSSIFFGVPTSPYQKSSDNNDDKRPSQQWKMNSVHCKTTYEPIVDESGSLTSIVVAGSLGEDMDIMLPKSHMFYNEAWILDLSDGEKDAKRTLDRFGGLGFVDSKKAYRGLFTSGTLRFLLPYYEEGTEMQGQAKKGHPKAGDAARDWFQTVIVCEVNERREPSACQTGRDITYKTGGVNATEVTLLDTPGTLYLGKKICSYINIPGEATITSREAMLLEDPNLRSSKRVKVTTAVDEGKAELGLSLELTVNNHHIIARDKACSVSHVVWEQRTPEGIRLPTTA